MMDDRGPFKPALAHAGLIAAFNLLLFCGWFVIGDPRVLFVLEEPERVLGRQLMTGLVAGGLTCLSYLLTVLSLRLTLGKRYSQPPSRLIWELCIAPTVLTIFFATMILSPLPIEPWVVGTICTSVGAILALTLVTADWAVYAMVRLAVTTGQSALVLVLLLATLALTGLPSPASLDRPVVFWQEDLPALLAVALAVALGGSSLALLGAMVPALSLPPQWWQISIMTWSWYYLGGAVMRYFGTARMASVEGFVPTTLGQLFVLLLVPLGVPVLGRGARRVRRQT